MIITLTGKPCSGKSTVAKIFCDNYNFKHISTGNMFREILKDKNLDILEFQKGTKAQDIDKIIDEESIKIGKTRGHEDILYDSRLGWYFIPNSFKVFLDLNEDEMALRLFNSERDITEKGKNIKEAKKRVTKRWEYENNRYKKLYKIDNTNMKNYDLIIDTKDKTPDQLANEIFNKYTEFVKNKKSKIS